MSRKLFVGNLPYQTEEDELQELFQRFGGVESVRVMRDRETGRSRGFAFVEMSTDAGAQAAASGLNGQSLGGRDLTVNEARPRPEPVGVGGGAAGARGSRREPRW
jgi:RNA recognition motif-containing protein